MKILEVIDISKTFKSDLLKKNKTALEKVSMSFYESSATAVIGHNGAGKTTFIRCVLGLVKPDEGEILFKGKPLDYQDRIHIGYMPEVSKLNEELTPEETLRIHLKFYPSQQAGISSQSEALERVGLSQHSQMKVKELSKGLKRRLAFAMAAIHKPKLLILDEPFAGLDPIGHSLMEGWIEQEKARGAAIIMSSHQVSAITRVCERFRVLSKGQLLYSSDSEEYEKPASGYQIELSGVDETSLKDLLNQYNLAKPIAWHSNGFLQTLNFETYSDAGAALKKFLAEGMIIGSFKETSRVNETFILSLLKEGYYDQTSTSN